MVKSCRRYWSKEIADSIVQLEGVRFDNPMFSLTTSFDRDDFTRLLTTDFGIAQENVDRFFESARGMNFSTTNQKRLVNYLKNFFPAVKM